MRWEGIIYAVVGIGYAWRISFLYELKQLPMQPPHDFPILLNTEEMEQPYQVLERFYSSPLSYHRRQLWECLSAAVGAGAEGLDGVQVGEVVFYCRELEELLEAGWVIWQERKKATS